MGYIENVPNHTRARAHSAAALAHYRKFRRGLEADPEAYAMRDDIPDYEWSLYTAIDHANESVRLGLLSHAALEVGTGFRTYMRFEWDNIMDDMPMYAPIRQALAKHDTCSLAEEERHRAKVTNDAQAYVCAAEGCGLAGLQKKALRACAGSCAADVKPHYCSKECQKKVRLCAYVPQRRSAHYETPTILGLA